MNDPFNTMIHLTDRLSVMLSLTWFMQFYKGHKDTVKVSITINCEYFQF